MRGLTECFFAVDIYKINNIILAEPNFCHYLKHNCNWKYFIM